MIPSLRCQPQPLVLALLAAGCAGVPSSSRDAQLAEPRPASAAAARPAARAVAPAADGPAPNAVLIPPPDSAAPFYSDADGTCVLLAGLRARVRPDGVALADEMFAARIRGATPAGRGWVFVGEDGMVAAADDCVGPLRRLGDVPRAMSGGATTSWPGTMPGESSGRAAVINADGQVWSTDGSEEVAPMASIPGGRALSVAFADARRGAVLTESGLYVTDDAGGSFRAVDTRGEVVTAVTLRAGELTVATPTGPRTIAPGDALVAPVRPTLLRAPPPLGPAAREALAAALRARFPQLAAAYGAVRDDGTAALAQGRAVYRFERDAPAAAAVQPEALPHPTCRVTAWGHAFAARCGGRQINVLRSDDGAQFTAIDGAPYAAYDTVFADDGRHVAARCGGPSDRTALCVYVHPSAAPRRVALPTPIVRIAAMSGRLVLLELAGAHGTSLAVVDGDVGTARPVTLAPPADAAAGTVRGAGFTRDGRVYALYERAASRWLALGAPDAPLALRALPAGVDAVALLDARTGIASGRTLAEVFTTDDGGARWEPLRLRLDGDARVVAHRAVPIGLLTAPVRCNALGCGAGAVWVPRGGAAVLADAPPVPTLASRASPAAPDAWAPYQQVQCADAGARLPDDPPPPAVQLAPASARRAVLRGPDAALALAVWTEPTNTPMLAASWRGRDERGAYAAASAAAPRTVTEPASDEAARPNPPSWTLRAATRRGALLERCLTIGLCEALWVVSGGGVVRVGAAPVRAMGASSPLRLSAAIAAPDGGVLVALSAAIARGAVDEVIRVGPDGAARARHVFRWEGNRRVRALAVHAGVEGMAASDRDAPAQLRFYPLASPDAPVALGTLSASGLPPACTRAAAAGAPPTVLVAPHFAFGQYLVAGPALDRFVQAWGTYELDGEAVCTRSLAVWPRQWGPPGPAPFAFAAAVSSAPGAPLAGQVTSETGTTTRITCARAP